MQRWQSDVLRFLAPELRVALEGLPGDEAAGAREVRLRAGLPLCVVGRRGPRLLKDVIVAARHLDDALERMCRGSVYSRQREFELGFLTLPGGHRVGMAGRTVGDDGAIRLTPATVTSLSIRIAREIRGAATGLLARIGGPLHPASTLIYSPPGAGKTTVLRDLVRSLAHHLQVGVVDERGELGGSDGRTRHLDLGPMADVIEMCSKAEAMMWFIRALGPDVVATDEIGGPVDARAVADAARAGITVIATAHAGSLEELAGRAALGELVSRGAFRYLVRLGFRSGPGTVEAVTPSGEVAKREARRGGPRGVGRSVPGHPGCFKAEAAGPGA